MLCVQEIVQFGLTTTACRAMQVVQFTLAKHCRRARLALLSPRLLKRKSSRVSSVEKAYRLSTIWEISPCLDTGLTSRCMKHAVYESKAKRITPGRSRLPTPQEPKEHKRGRKSRPITPSKCTCSRPSDLLTVRCKYPQKARILRIVKNRPLEKSCGKRFLTQRPEERHRWSTCLFTLFPSGLGHHLCL